MDRPCYRPCCPRGATLQDNFGRYYCSETCVDAHLRFLEQEVYPPSGPRVFFQIVVDGKPWPFLAFYYPDKDTAWDKRCNSGFLGNFYPLETELWMPLGGQNYCFQTAEAAFQVLKYPNYPDIVQNYASCVKGDDAVKLNRTLRQNQILFDESYGGRVNNWRAMWEVLQRKFLHTGLQDRLLKTGDCFLLEHNSHPNTKEGVWSDKSDGTGQNWLGMQLMLLRDHLRKQRGELPGQWEQWLTQTVDMNTGAPKNLANWDFWQTLVKKAAAEVNQWAATQGAAQSQAVSRRQTGAVKSTVKPSSHRVWWGWGA